ncbi:hypothetical protein VTO42DRAFT_4903 [Malbranchea cinnamomea]
MDAGFFEQSSLAPKASSNHRALLARERRPTPPPAPQESRSALKSYVSVPRGLSKLERLRRRGGAAYAVYLEESPTDCNDGRGWAESDNSAIIVNPDTGQPLPHQLIQGQLDKLADVGDSRRPQALYECSPPSTNGSSNDADVESEGGDPSSRSVCFASSSDGSSDPTDCSQPDGGDAGRSGPAESDVPVRRTRRLQSVVSGRFYDVTDVHVALQGLHLGQTTSVEEASSLPEQRFHNSSSVGHGDTP